MRLLRLPLALVAASMNFVAEFATEAAPDPDPLAWITRKQQVTTDQLKPVNFRILSAAEILPGQTQIEFTADLTNSALATFTMPQANLLQTAGGFAAATNIATNFTFLTFTDVGPLSQASPLRSMVVEVAAPLATATNSFAANVTNFLWKSFGYETPVFATNVVKLDGSLSNSVGKQQGLTYWITNPPPHFSLVTTGWLVLPTRELPLDFCCNEPDPFVVETVITNGSGDLGFTRATGEIDWLEFIESATLRLQDPILMDFSDEPRDSEVSPSGLGRPIVVETVQEGLSYFPKNMDPISPPTFDLANGFSPVSGVKLSASVGVGGFGVHPEVRIRDFKIAAVGLKVEAHPEATFRMSVDEAIEFPRTEHDLANFNLPEDAIGIPHIPDSPKFTLPLGPFSIELTVFLRPFIGAEAEVTGQTEFNAAAFGDFAAELLVEDEQPSFSHEMVMSPLSFTHPQLRSDAEASGTVFAGLEVGGEVVVNGPLSLKLASAKASATVEPEANLRVRPFDDPWWSLSAGVNVYARIAAELPTLIPGTYKHLSKTFPIVSASQLALSAPAGGGPAPGANAPAKPFAGTDMRWSKVWRTDYHPSVIVANPNEVAMTLNETGNVVVAWQTALAQMQVAELDRNGNSLWQKSYSVGFSGGNFSDFDRVPGDGYVLATESSSGVWLMRLNDAGNLMWANRYDLSGGVESRVQVAGFRDTNGQPAIAVSALMGTNAVVFRVNADGGLAWAKQFALEGNTYIMNLRAARQHGLFLVGQTDEDVAICNTPNWAPCLRSTDNGLIMKLDEAGNLVWANAFSTAIFNDVVETSDGKLLAVGGSHPTPFDPYHGVSAHLLDPNGSAIWQTTYAVDMARTGETGGASSKGDSLVDEARAVALTKDGWVLAGHTGTGTNTAAWIMRVADNGEPLWHTMWDGPNYDVGLQLLDRGDSYVMLGISASFLTQPGSSGVNTPWLSALPHSGQLDFKPAANVTTYYRYPAVNGFSGESVANTQIQSGSRAVTPIIQTITATTQAVSVTVADYWSPSAELAQTAFEPVGGRPTLSISQIGSNALVHWPVLGSEGFTPQVANTVTSSWSSVTNTITRTGEEWSFQTRATNVQRYFRLWR